MKKVLSYHSCGGKIQLLIHFFSHNLPPEKHTHIHAVYHLYKQIIKAPTQPFHRKITTTLGLMFKQWDYTRLMLDRKNWTKQLVLFVEYAWVCFPKALLNYVTVFHQNFLSTFSLTFIIVYLSRIFLVPENRGSLTEHDW